VKNKDNIFIGFTLGIFAPFIGILVFYFMKASSTPFTLFLEVAFENKMFLTAMLSFSLLADAVLLTIFANRRMDKIVKGIFIAVMLYAVPTLIYKLFF
jgi:hypothetical protein